MYICLCRAITQDRIEKVVRDGARDVDSVVAECSAGSDCGTCRFKINKIINSVTNEDAQSGRDLAV